MAVPDPERLILQVEAQSQYLRETLEELCDLAGQSKDAPWGGPAPNYLLVDRLRDAILEGRSRWT